MAIKRVILLAISLFTIIACNKEVPFIQEYKIINQSDYDITLQPYYLGEKENSLHIMSKDTFRKVEIGDVDERPKLEIFRVIYSIEVSYDNAVKRSYTNEKDSVIFEHRSDNIYFLDYNAWSDGTYTFTNEDYEEAVRLMNEE